MRLDRATFRYVERELYSYDIIKRRIAEMREEILEGSRRNEVAVKVAPGDVTATKAVKLVSSLAIARMESVLLAIDKALNDLTEDHRKLFELKYRRGKRIYEICHEMYISRTKYFELRRQLVYRVAHYLGLLE